MLAFPLLWFCPFNYFEIRKKWRKERRKECRRKEERTEGKLKKIRKINVCCMLSMFGYSNLDSHLTFFFQVHKHAHRAYSLFSVPPSFVSYHFLFLPNLSSFQAPLLFIFLKCVYDTVHVTVVAYMSTSEDLFASM